MKQKCDNCERDATVHLTEIIDGQKTERHLCEVCAASEGVTGQAALPISKLLEDFVAKTQTGARMAELVCEHCGISFLEFRQSGLLGCPNDYDVFADQLAPLLARMHAGFDRHTGKTPGRAAGDEARQVELLRLRGQLKQAVAAEAYERAAELRDRIKCLESAPTRDTRDTRDARDTRGSTRHDPGQE